jgi:hypothetical protein
VQIVNALLLFWRGFLKKYLNRRQINDYVTFAHFISFVEQKLLPWSDYNITTKDERKRFKTIVTHGSKILGNMINRLEDDTRRLIRNSVTSHEILLCTTQRAKVKLDEIADADGSVTVNKRAVYDMMEIAMERCNGCKDDDYIYCTLRSCASQLDIPYASDEENKCQYNC